MTFTECAKAHSSQSLTSASRSKLPVKVVKLYHSSEVQKITLTYNNFRYPNGPHKAGSGQTGQPPPLTGPAIP